MCVYFFCFTLRAYIGQQGKNYLSQIKVVPNLKKHYREAIDDAATADIDTATWKSINEKANAILTIAKPIADPE